MGLQSALTTALTGLQAAETTIDVIGNNVANSNTVGFKKSEVRFATQFLQTQSIGSAPSDTSGGTNPRQIGLGVRVAQISPDFSQGTIEISSNPLDLAIQGDGFLVVQGSQGEPLFTRNGQLGLNSQNEIVTSSGNKVMGYPVNESFELQTAQQLPLQIPLGSSRVAQQTTSATFEGVLNPSVDQGTQESVSQSEVLGNRAITSPTDDDLSILSRDAPTVGTSTENTTTAGGLSTGTYRYRLAWRDAAGGATNDVTSASVEWTVDVTAGNSVDINSLPSAGVDYDEWVLYRTEANGTEFYELRSDSTATALPLNDTVDDATLTAGGTATPVAFSAIENGTYSYYVTYYNSTTGDESIPSQRLGPISLDDDTSSIRVDLSQLDPPASGTGIDFDRIRIYRNTAGDSSTYYMVDELTAPSGSPYQTYTDTASNSVISGSTTLDFDGPKAGGGTALVDLQTRNGDTYTPAFDLGTASSGLLTFEGMKGGSSLDGKSMTITTSTTVDELIGFMHDALGLDETSNVSGVPFPPGGGEITIVNGVIQINSNFGEENAIDIPLSAFRLQPEGEPVSSSVDIIFSETQQANGPGTTTEFLVYDSLGSPLTVRLTTVLETSTSNSTTYRWYATSGDSNPALPDQSTVVGNGVLVFDGQGDLQDAPSARISVQRELDASESPLEIDLDFSSVTSLSVNNASGEPTSTMNMTSQDGFPPGVLTDFIVTDSGLIQGQFSNGTQRTLGQLVMARFANNQGLEQVGDSLFAASVNSGEIQYGEPGEDGLGTLKAGAVELSNTDVGQDLIEMILAQTQYQAGSRVISATQELLDELLSLQR